MSSRYDEAVSELYRAAHDAFVTERKRLADELKAAGDKTGAARLAKLPRPSVSAWAVNQLWWHAPKDFEQLFDSAKHLRSGKLDARAAHREALGKLSARGRKLLGEGGHAVSEATVRRVEMTLAGLAASGSFDPDPPGALSKDRDPPGFAAFSEAAFASEPAKTKPAAAEPHRTDHHPEHAAAEKARHEAAAAKKREAEARAKRETELRQLHTQLRDAKAELKKRENERERVSKELATAERELEQAQAAVGAVEKKIAAAEK